MSPRVSHQSPVPHGDECSMSMKLDTKNCCATASQSDTLLTFLPMIAIFVVFYFLLIRPQQKKQKEARAMLDALEKGNEVVTAGGILGRIVKLDDQYVTVEIAPNTQMVVQRGAISQLLPKGTIKAL